MKGNYGSDNIYEQIRREKLQQQQQEGRPPYYDHQDPYDHPDRRRSYPRYEQYDPHHQSSRTMFDYYSSTTARTRTTATRPSSFMSSSSSLEMNGIIYIVLIAAAVYVGHQYFGINPWQMILFLQMIQNGGGRRGGRFMWYNGGGGYYNGGWGGGRHPYQRRRGYW
jgi:hypothetical protein